jgi:hypothetical protein
MTSNQSPQEYFRLILVTVVGQAFDAAGYALEERPAQWAGGQFRFHKLLPDDLHGFIEWQHLHYIEGRPSLFRVTFTRTDQSAPGVASDHPRYAQRTLSALVVEDFKVAILPSADHWWSYRDTTELGRALGEAGSLAIGYGMPWLAGELKPKD